MKQFLELFSSFYQILITTFIHCPMKTNTSDFLNLKNQQLDYALS